MTGCFRLFQGVTQNSCELAGVPSPPLPPSKSRTSKFNQLSTDEAGEFPLWKRIPLRTCPLLCSGSIHAHSFPRAVISRTFHSSPSPPALGFVSLLRAGGASQTDYVAVRVLCGHTPQPFVDDGTRSPCCPAPACKRLSSCKGWLQPLRGITGL